MISAVNYQFERFMEFAEERVKAGKDTAIARTGEVRVEGPPGLEERAIYATDKTDFVGMSLVRTDGAKRANDEVRELFRKSIADMFGGEGNIPDSVKDAMLLKDYGSGKPLTARRILEVGKAIEALDRANIFGLGDTDHELAKMASAAGYSRHDFGKLNMAVNFLMNGQSVDARTALAEVLEKGSAANRAMNAGPMYMKDDISFMHAYGIFNVFVNCDKDNLHTASRNGSKEATKNLAGIADKLSGKYKNMLILAENFRAAAELPDNTLVSMRQHFESAVRKMAKLQSDISSGTLSDRKEIYEKLINTDEPAYFHNMVHMLERHLDDEGKRTPAVDEFLQHLKGLSKDLDAARDNLAAAYRNAVAADAKSKLLAAAHEGGMATGTPGGIPADVLDRLDEFLAEDPFGNGEKILALCAGIEQNGHAAETVLDAIQRK